MKNQHLSVFNIVPPAFTHEDFYKFISNENSTRFVKRYFEDNQTHLPKNVYSIHDDCNLLIKRKFKKIVSLFRDETDNEGPFYSEYSCPNSGYCGNYIVVEECKDAVVIIGGFSFTRKELIDYSTNTIISVYYELSWVWIHPYRRNQKLFSNLWNDLRSYYGHFIIQKPYSEEMKRFMLSKGYFETDM